MSDRDRREMRQGAGDAFSNSFELIATPLIFGVIGWYLDRRLDIFPVFTLVLAAIALTYGVWKLYSQYVESMDDLLEQRRSNYGHEPSNG